MAYILHIETATEDCSVALSCDGQLVLEMIADAKLSHATSLQPLINKLLSELKVNSSTLSAVAVSMGPGSYTGLRIGLSAAKGMAYALNIPLIGVATLRSAAIGASRIIDVIEGDLFMPVIDARRMEVYTMLFDSKMNVLQKPSSMIMDANSLDSIQANRIIFSGNGTQKLKVLYADCSNCIFVTEAVHLASNGIAESWQKYHSNDFENTAYCEPFYLKEFIPGFPKVKGLR